MKKLYKSDSRACGFSKGDGLTLSQVRECVKDFVEKKNLQNQADPKLVNLSDPLLSEAVLVNIILIS